MRQTTADRIQDQAARAEAWKRYAFRQTDRAEEYHARWQDTEMYALRSENEVTREVQREASEDARAAYSEGYWKGRDDNGESGF